MQIQESVARTLAILTAANTAAIDMIASAGLEELMQLLKCPAATPAALGNLSLCMGNMAKQTKLLPVLREAGAVAPLLGDMLPCHLPSHCNHYCI